MHIYIQYIYIYMYICIQGGKHDAADSKVDPDYNKAAYWWTRAANEGKREIYANGPSVLSQLYMRAATM